MDLAEKFTRRFARDDVIFAEGSAGNHMYLIVAGQVGIVKATDSGPRLLATLGEGEIFGEMALVDSGQRAAGAVAVSDDTELMAIDQARFVYLVSQQPAFALSVMRVMAQRIAALGVRLSCN